MFFAGTVLQRHDNSIGDTVTLTAEQTHRNVDVIQSRCYDVTNLTTTNTEHSFPK